MLYGKVTQLYTYMSPIPFYLLFHHDLYQEFGYRSLCCMVDLVFLSILNVNSLHLLIIHSQSIPPLPPLPFGNLTPVLHAWESVSAVDRFIHAIV